MKNQRPHQVWATLSGTDLREIERQIDALVRWGVEAVEFRVDLIPEELWPEIFQGLGCPVPWWVAHFGTGDDASAARRATFGALEGGTEGMIFHSRCEHLEELIEASRKAGRPFAAPYHSQEPLTREGALEEFAHQEALEPAFRKIAVRAHNFEQALALVQATHQASRDGGTPAVGAVFGPQRWARVALPLAGSAITFLVARAVSNEVGGDDRQLQIDEINQLLRVPGLLDEPFSHIVSSEPRRVAAG